MDIVPCFNFFFFFFLGAKLQITPSNLNFKFIHFNPSLLPKWRNFDLIFLNFEKKNPKK